MASQSLSYTPSFITDYFPYDGPVFVRVIPDDGSLASVDGGLLSIAYLHNSTDPTLANLLDDTIFKMQAQYFLGCETKFDSMDGVSGIFLKGLMHFNKPSTLQFKQEGTAASGDIKFNANISDGVTLTLGLNGIYTTYRFKNTLAQINDVKIGATAADTLDNLRRAIGNLGTYGVNYYVGTIANKVFSSSITSGVLTYVDKIKCKRLAGYLISASSYANIVIRTPMGGVDGSLLLEIPSTSYTENFQSLYTDAIIYSFGRKETYSSIDSVFIPLIGDLGGQSLCYNSDLVNVSGFKNPVIVGVFNPNTTIDDDYSGYNYNLLNGSTKYISQFLYELVQQSIYTSNQQSDYIRASLAFRISGNLVCSFLKLTIFY